MPNTTIMMHHPSGAARGQATDIHNEARELMRVRNYVNGVLSNVTDRPVEQVCSHDFTTSSGHACDRSTWSMASGKLPEAAGAAPHADQLRVVPLLLFLGGGRQGAGAGGLNPKA